MEKLEVGKCYASVRFDKQGVAQLNSVFKAYPCNDPRFGSLIYFKGISVSGSVFGSLESGYMSKDRHNCIEIPEEEFQKIWHLWKVYEESLETAVDKLQNSTLIKMFSEFNV